MGKQRVVFGFTKVLHTPRSNKSLGVDIFYHGGLREGEGLKRRKGETVKYRTGLPGITECFFFSVSG